jgi:hypothetical protein
MCPSPSRNRRRGCVLPLAVSRKEMRRIGQAGATGVVAMAVWQAGRDHRAPSRRGTLRSACTPAASSSMPRPVVPRRAESDSVHTGGRANAGTRKRLIRPSRTGCLLCGGYVRCGKSVSARSHGAPACRSSTVARELLEGGETDTNSLHHTRQSNGLAVQCSKPSSHGYR